MVIRSGTPSPTPSPTPSSDPYQAAVNAFAGAGTTGAGARTVYMGQYAPVRPRGSSNQTWKNIQGVEGQVKGSNRDVWMTKAQAEQEYYSWSLQQQKAFVDQAILGGLAKLGDGPLEGAALWKKFVAEAANYGAAGAKVSPVDLMATYKNASGGRNSWTSAGVWQINTVTGERKYVGPGTYLGGGKAQQVDTRVDLTDPDTARAVSTKLFQDLMGRDPGAGELAAFANALHSAEQSNPVVATTTTQYDMDTGQALSSSTTQSGGVTAEGKAYIGEQQIKKKKEYGAFQAATTYQNALESLVFGSPE